MPADALPKEDFVSAWEQFEDLTVLVIKGIGNDGRCIVHHLIEVVRVEGLLSKFSDYFLLMNSFLKFTICLGGRIHSTPFRSEPCVKLAAAAGRTKRPSRSHYPRLGIEYVESTTRNARWSVSERCAIYVEPFILGYGNHRA